MIASAHQFPRPAEAPAIRPHVVAPPSPLEAAVVATRRIPPLWRLRDFVAVNPFLGLVDREFESAARLMTRVTGGRMTVARALVADAIASGRVTRADLAAALDAGEHVAGAPATAEALAAFAHAPVTPPAPAPTVADVAAGRDWAAFVTNAVSTWAATHFDEGQALWSSPWRDLPPWAAWRAEAAFDRTPEIAGVRGFRATIQHLPASAPEAIAAMLERVAVPENARTTYLHRLLASIGGWASYARGLDWQRALAGDDQSTLGLELLAIRLAWEVALLEGLADEGVGEAWERHRDGLLTLDLGPAGEAAFAGDLALQRAFERASRRELLTSLAGAPAAPAAGTPRAQAVFCIDVRSEPYRRALESVAPGLATLGCAGFFGAPIEYVRLGDEHGSAQCPALLAPSLAVAESVRDAGIDDERGAARRRRNRRRAAAAWRSFKSAAVSCFGFVGGVGLAYAPKLVIDAFGAGRPVPDPASFGLDPNLEAEPWPPGLCGRDRQPQLGPGLEPRTTLDGRPTGLGPAQRLALAEGALRGMSLTQGFARLVLVVGHRATTVNNPHAAGLDCGACGGHSGEVNARVTAAILRDPDVRSGLRARGIALPDDTVFVAAVHDTTTDNVTLFDVAAVPPSHEDDLARVRRELRAASALARAERARRLGIAPGLPLDEAVVARSQDWSQVRPEWGLAGCRAFIVAPRHRTAGLDLGGRAFLHSYDWRQDEELAVLTQIMTGPMVVGSWISFQYYASTVDNAVFGSGNKTLHNVTATLGVFEGNGGDLRVGLPWQSVHDGERFVHEPVRLAVVIEAPIDAIELVLEAHPEVRQLFEHHWLELYAMDGHGRVARRYDGGRRWAAMEDGDGE